MVARWLEFTGGLGALRDGLVETAHRRLKPAEASSPCRLQPPRNVLGSSQTSDPAAIDADVPPSSP